jgi:hypothetical protein
MAAARGAGTHPALCLQLLVEWTVAERDLPRHEVSRDGRLYRGEEGKTLFVTNEINLIPLDR